MVLSLPFFVAVGWWLRNEEPRLAPRDWAAVAGLGFIGYYLASFLDFIGLQYVGAGVGRLILFLYPTLVLLLSLLFLHKKPTRRQLVALFLTYAGIALVVSSQVHGGAEGRLFLLGARWSSPRRSLRGVSRRGQRAHQARRLDALHRLFDDGRHAAGARPVLHPRAGLGAASCRPAVWIYAIVLATFSTVLPLFLQAEALRRIGASRVRADRRARPGERRRDERASASTSRSRGPQALGGALVIVGVLLVSLKRS